MRKVILLCVLIFAFITPVSAMEFTAPAAPDGALEYMPKDTESFGEGLWYVIKSAAGELMPGVMEATGTCISLVAVVILTSLIQSFSSGSNRIVDLTGALSVGLLLIQPANSLINLGTTTVSQLSEYGKLLIPVMSAAMAAQGGVSASAALYTGTMLFSSLLTSIISKLIVPLVYVYLCLCIANSAIGESALGGMRDFIKWLKTWCLKIVLYVFTGYIGITKVVSGSADAAALKATKLVISGSVPVVGSIISDASETILVSAGIMKNAAGVYGLLAVLAICVGPFLQIGVHYLLLKITAAVCAVFGSKTISGLIKDFSTAMGYALAMTGTVCLMLMVSIVCFMKGVV